MIGRTHLAAGALSSILILPLVGELSVFHVLLAALGGIFPDMDAKESKIKWLNISPFKSFPIRPFWLPSAIISRFCKHRGGLHSLLGMVICTIIVQLIFFIPGINEPSFGWTAFAAGFLSHLITDSLTIYGIPFFYPWNKTNYHAIPKKWWIKTGSTSEQIWDIVFLLLMTGFLFHLTMTGKIVF